MSRGPTKKIPDATRPAPGETRPGVSKDRTNKAQRGPPHTGYRPGQSDALLNKKITVKDPVTGKKVKARVSTFIGAAWQHAKAADVQTKRK